MKTVPAKFGLAVLSQSLQDRTQPRQRETQSNQPQIKQPYTKTGSKRSRLFRVGKWALGILLVLALVRTFIGEASLVPTASMEGTILVGDHLFWNKALYGPEVPFTHWRLPRLKHVHRGEIVAFHYPLDPAQIFLKRAVALGGDRVEIHNDVLYVNGAAVQENYAVHHTLRFHFAPSEMAARTVPAGTLFMLGDNRDFSSDSRDWGVVPEENVIGSPFIVFWSYDAPSAEWLDEKPAHRLRFFASMCAHLFSRTRWERTGTLL
ncbi:MAG TPA: signal peptidase I [Terriglobales bacterium]|jgi:signal peptidase I|nr:signal peptidase I [Terriglobales bacterium]